MLNCQEAVDRLYGYLDRQLSEEELAEVRQHLARCPHCDDHFRFEENVLRRVHQACRGVETPADLRERVLKLCADAQQRN